MASSNFSLKINEVNPVTGRGIILFGKIDSGEVNVGDRLQITGGWLPRTVIVAGIQLVNKSVQTATAGQYVGLLIDGLNLADVQRGEVVTSPYEPATKQ